MSAPSSQAIRRYVLTGAVAAITVTGAWYGAGLKTQQEQQQERQAHIEAPAADRIAQMEVLRANLMKRKIELETKIDELARKSKAAPTSTSSG